jgi:hypothetical protein
MSLRAFIVVDDVLLVDDELLGVPGHLVRLGRVLGRRVLGLAAAAELLQPGVAGVADRRCWS